MAKIKKTILISDSYKVDIIEEVVASVVLSYYQKIKFKSLSAKSKITRLNYLKGKKTAEKTLIKTVQQSKYLLLYKDNLGFHLRLMEDIPSDELDLEHILLDYLLSEYSIYLNEDVNTGMSGDINRILISKGTLVFG